MKTLPAALLFCASLAACAAEPPRPGAHPAGNPVEGQPAPPLDMVELQRRLHTGLASLHAAGRLTPRATLDAQLTECTACALNLPALHGQPADLATLYREGRKGVMIVGDTFSCGKCGKAHLGSTASGYVVSASGIMVTNYHVIASKGDAAPGPVDPAADAHATGASPLPAGSLGLGAMDSEGRVHAVKKVLAASRKLDVAIVQLDGEGFTPLPVNAEAQVGDPVAVISHPLRCFYMLSSGIVTHHVRLRENGEDRGPRLCVSAEYGIGSSGAPVFNMKGEVVGMVSSTMPIMTPSANGKAATEQMVMRYCVPMKDILDLVKKPAK